MDNRAAMSSDSTTPSDLNLSAGDDAHYLRAVTEFGEQHAVVTTAPIFAANGMKLVEAGIRVDGRLYDRLVSHRLGAPIDHQLGVDGAVDAAALADVARSLIADRAFCTRVATAAGGADALLAPIRRIPLPPPIAFKLTLMRESRPELFAHSLQVTLVALLLGIGQRRSASGLTDLAAAALLHDLGVLHIDPALLESGHRMTPDERRHLFAHPITASMILKTHGAYAQAVVRAVVEHHERLDGSGYPQGLRGDQISADGRILMLAEVVSAMFEKNWDAPGQRLSLILRLNHRKFDRTLVDAVGALLREDADELDSAGSAQSEVDRILALGRLFDGWRALAGTGADPPAHPSEEHLDRRLGALERSMHEAGLDPALLAFVLDGPERDPATVAELSLLAQETRWQVDALVQDLWRRWPQIDAAAAPRTAAFLDLLGDTEAPGVAG